MNKREFLDIVFALAPNEANAIMDAFDEYVESNEPHWIPVTERPISKGLVLVTYNDGDVDLLNQPTAYRRGDIVAWCNLPEPYKGVTE